MFRRVTTPSKGGADGCVVEHGLRVRQVGLGRFVLGLRELNIRLGLLERGPRGCVVQSRLVDVILIQNARSADAGETFVLGFRSVDLGLSRQDGRFGLLDLSRRLAKGGLLAVHVDFQLGHVEDRKDVVLFDAVADIDVPLLDVPRDLAEERSLLKRLDVEAGLFDAMTDGLSLRLDGVDRVRRLG